MKQVLCKKGDTVVIKTGGWMGFYGTVETSQLAPEEQIEVRIVTHSSPVVSFRRSDLIHVTDGVKETPSSPFREVCDKMSDTYEKKNADYGDSFSKSVQKYGYIAALTRMSDKFNRMENIILKNERKVAEESLKDTVLDLASYAVMLYMELTNKK